MRRCPHEPKDHIVITRHLVVSCDGKELLMVRHEVQLPAAFHPPAYTRKVEIFKADMDDGFPSSPPTRYLKARRSFSAEHLAWPLVPMET
jgi:hypothetical protein